MDLYDTVGGISSGKLDGEAKTVTIPDDGIDWILMNPPYAGDRGTTGTFSFTGMTDEESAGCRKRWRKLLHLTKTDKCAQMGMGFAPSFLALAKRKCKTGGRIGFVLPMTAAFGKGWGLTRKMMERNFKDLMVVAHASGIGSLSADTAIEEILLVGTKCSHDETKTSKPPVISCVTLRVPCDLTGEAGEVARAIQKTVTRRRPLAKSLPVIVGKEEIGVIHFFTQHFPGAPWSPCGSLHADLVLSANELLQGTLSLQGTSIPLPVSMCRISDLFSEVGLGKDRIGHIQGSKRDRGGFVFDPVYNTVDAIGTDRSLWSVNSAEQTSMLVTFTHKGTPYLQEREDLRKEARSRQSSLFYACNMRWNAQRVLVASTRQAGHGGSGWVALLHKDERIRKCFALWGNSTLGMLVQWTQGQRTQAGRSRGQVKAVTSYPCPRLNDLPDDCLTQATLKFDELANRELLPASQSYADPVRKEIDLAVLKMFGIENQNAVNVLDSMRWLWGNEPSVHAQKKSDITKLKDYHKSHSM